MSGPDEREEAKSEKASVPFWCFWKSRNEHMLDAQTMAALGASTVAAFPERTLRPLAKLKTKEQKQEAWEAALKAGGGKPTAKQVEAAVELILYPDQIHPST